MTHRLDPPDFIDAFDAVGSEEGLRAIIDEFVDGCFDDMMIGYLFAKADRKRVKRFEYEHAAEHLGAPITYGGREIRAAHGAHRILGGQFDRRLTILRQVLVRHAVPEPVRLAWLAFHESFRAKVTTDARGECSDSKVSDVS